MVSSCLFRWSFTCQSLAVNARNCAKTTKFKSDILETPVILMPDLVRKSREGWNCRFQKTPARKVGTRSRQCRPKVPGRFAFPGARNPRICSISRFGKTVPVIFPRDFPGVFLGNPRTDPGNSHSLLEFSDLRLQTQLQMPTKMFSN